MLLMPKGYENVLKLLKEIEKNPEWKLIDESTTYDGMGMEDVDLGYQYYNETKDQALSFVINHHYKQASVKKIKKQELRFFSRKKAVDFVFSSKKTKSINKPRNYIAKLLQEIVQNPKWSKISDSLDDEIEQSPLHVIRYYNTETKEAIEITLDSVSADGIIKKCDLSLYNIFDSDELDKEHIKKQ